MFQEGLNVTSQNQIQSKEHRPPPDALFVVPPPLTMLSIVIHLRAFTRAARTTHRAANGCVLRGGVASASASASACSTSMMHRSRHIATATPTTTSFCGASSLHRYHHQPQMSFFLRTNFSYAGPRKLSDILKSELLVDKSSTEIVRCFVLVCILLRKTISYTVDSVRRRSHTFIGFVFHSPIYG